MSDAARAFFDAIAPRYDREFARPREELRPRMIRLVALLGPPRDVLDLGVGTGRELSYLLDAGHRVVGLDFSDKMLAECARRARPIPCVHADLWRRLPFGDASFDAVLALFGTLAHAPHPGALAELGGEVARVLRPRGLFFAEAPAPAWARAHPTFVDAPTGARIDVTAPGPEEWRAAFAAFELDVGETPEELTVVARRA